MKYLIHSFLALVLLVVSQANTYAQNARFVEQGKIIYERKVNNYALLNKIFSSEEASHWRETMMENYKKNNPQFSVDEFTLIFNNQQSLYTPIAKDKKSEGFFMDLGQIASNNIVYKNFTENKTVTQISLVGENYLVTDSLRHIKWKITDELRTIAGFACKRANGLMFDSIYVVAFYTDQIIPAVGPESLGGLPGAILGAAFPHDNTTWFATKVYAENINNAEFVAPTKGKKQTGIISLINTLSNTMRDMGKGFGTVVRRLMF